MERWLQLGFAGLHPMEPCPGFDIYEAKRRWGDRIALFGNIDLAGVLTQGTSEEVAQDTRTHIERLSVGGGYVCGSSHHIGEDVPIANLQAMSEAIARAGR
jgi:uroporphyrinogen decarboxylase